ncbi:MAG: DEAD/DEAH box helicase family protein [Deltaproteobacteria bacterium]|nr:DEAD/DEAH box helicase family protein [Deltaproteobacteria bacterium]
MPQTPDWSYQDVAVRRCREKLNSSSNVRVGLVIPTGGGKTRIALMVCIEEILASPEGGRILWVTHRKRLRLQAKRTLQRLVTENADNVPKDAVQLSERIEFLMKGDLASRLQRAEKGEIILVVVDEAHHAAAPSYSVLNQFTVRGLYLTATPVRTDLQPIGIDVIGFSITYRALFDKGVLVEPKFLEPAEVRWDNDASVGNFAMQILKYAEREFVKTLIVAPTVDKVVRLYKALRESLAQLEGHILGEEDLLYAHARQSSTGDVLEDFLDEFATTPRGILVATTELLGEGYDEPSINAVVVAYPTNSIIHMMQAGGRCLRCYEHKSEAFILQVRESEMAYHFEQRWLYQEISDFLRPQLVDCYYNGRDELSAAAEQILRRHHVDGGSCGELMKTIAEDAGGRICLLLYGLPYEGEPEKFESEGKWDVVFGFGVEGGLFTTVFNAFCECETQVGDVGQFLTSYAGREQDPSSRRRFVGMLIAMQYAHMEISGKSYHNADRRSYRIEKGTTWIKYVTFHPQRLLPAELDDFLRLCLNRAEIEGQYSCAPEDYVGVVRLALPLNGYIGFLLDAGQGQELAQNLRVLREQLQDETAHRQFYVVGRWKASLQTTKLPLVIVARIEQLLKTQPDVPQVLWLKQIED